MGYLFADGRENTAAIGILTGLNRLQNGFDL
jgi:hypothetical protein